MLFDQLNIHSWFTPERITLIIRFVLTIAIGFPLIKILKKVILKFLSRYLTPQSEMIVQRFVWYTLMIILLVSALNQLGFKLSALLGAAGIFGVAIGFASQTSFSNLISGMFMISEKTFSVGETIQVGGTLGEVLSIDLLSIKLRTFDNRYVRIPNENLIKSEMINISRFPIRRSDFEIGVSYKSDLQQVFKVIKEVISNNEFALKEPQALILVNQFADSSIILKIGVWTTKENYIECTNTIKIELYEKFKQEMIEIPFPQRILTVIQNDKK